MTAAARSPTGSRRERLARAAGERWFVRGAVLLAAVWVLVLHVILQALAFPVAILGPLDWSAHAATAIILLANLPRRLPAAFASAAIVASVAIDVDHVPQYVGTDVLTEGTPRPYPHSLATVTVASTAAVLLRGRARAVAAGIAFGVLAHVARDVATGAGVALLWPLSKDAVRIPFWVESAVLGALAMRAWQRPPRLSVGGSAREGPGAPGPD